METSQKRPLTDRQLSPEQLAQLAAGETLAVPASWDTFIAFVHQTRFRVEYHNGRMIIMGLAAFYHEVLIGTFITLLSGLLKGKGYLVAGSNVGVLREAGKGFYSPDSTVVKGKPTFWQGSAAIITNPYLVVEILSESTAAYDLYHKLPKYQTIISMQEVIFVDRFDRTITVCRRTDIPNSWTQTLYDKPDESVLLADDQRVPVRAFFADLPAESADEPAAQ